MEIDLDLRIGQFVELRDKIAALKEKHKAELEPYQKALDLLQGLLLDHLNTINVDNVKAKTGTAYRSMKKSATIADGDAFRRFVIGGEHWELADWRANAPAVEAMLEDTGEMPPGVNFSTHVTVGVRRG